MKNSIMYNYNFKDINILRENNGYRFKYNNNIYLFQPVINLNEILEIFEVLKYDRLYYKFIFNKDKSIFTNIGNQVFVLLKCNDNIDIDIDSFILKSIPIANDKKLLLDRSNWGQLWEYKQDYFEYQMKHLKGKYKIIDQSFDYYTGLCENAIEYFNQNVNLVNKKLVIAHNRINNNFFNPLELVFDYKARDIAEYLKFLFFSMKSDLFDIESFFKKLDFNYDDYVLLYCRLIYPNFYFDIYEQVVNEISNEEELKQIISLTSNYEKYLKRIYLIIKKDYEIPKLDWL